MTNLKELRLQKGLSQLELAKNLGTGQTLIGKYERGEVEPNIDMIKKMCKFFNVSTDYLLDNENDVAPAPSSNLTDNDQQLLKAFNLLDEKGKEKVLDYVNYELDKQTKIKTENKA